MSKFKSLLAALIITVSTVPFLALAQAPSPAASVVAAPSATPTAAIQVVAPAGQTVPDQDANSLLSQIFALASAGKWTAAIGALVVLCTYLVRKNFVDTNKIGSGSLPYVSLLLGALFGVGSNLLLGASPLAAAEAILFAGPVASHLWSAIFKLAVKKVI
jgi:hypothetical protein